MEAGFAEIDITPPIGTLKIGWLIRIVGEEVLDPLFARAAVLRNGAHGVGIIQTDLLSIRWTTVQRIRQGIERQHGFPGANVMVAATHNHAGPAIANVGDVPRDEPYVEELVKRCVEVFGRALAGAQNATVGFGRAFEFNVAFNRRVIMRDGTVQTHGRFSDPEALCYEGPIDPEVSTFAALGEDRRLLGCLVNFACHPTHHGDDRFFSAGLPGVLARRMKDRDCPVTLFLNGAFGNLHTSNPATGLDTGMEEAGLRLAADVTQALERTEFRAGAPLRTASRTIQLPYRTPTEAEVKGTVRGAQRFVDPTWYDRAMPALLERIRTRGTQPAEVQVLSIGDVAIAGIPAEYFVEHGLRIKEAAFPRRALVVAQANGTVGYVPTRHAFLRGGYETTFAPSSRLAPEAGDLLADVAIEVIRRR